MSIKEGSLVNVHFMRSESLFGVCVDHAPVAEGDCWKLIDRDGDQHNVVIFERMDEIRLPVGEKP